MSDQIALYKVDRDAFGHMLFDQYNGKVVYEIIEVDSIYLAVIEKDR